MVIIGGSYQAGLVDPQPITGPEDVLVFDMEASTFQAGGQVSLDGKPLWQPTNLVFPSAFLLAPDTLGVLWYDFFLKSDEGSQLRN